MKKIVLFLDSKLFGGIESHIIELSKLFKKNNVEFEILFYKKYQNYQLYNSLNENFCKYTFLNGDFYSLLSFLNKNNDIVLHTHGYKAGILGRFACKAFKTLCVSTFHAGEQGEGRVFLYNKIDHLTSFLSHNLIVSEKLRNKVYKPKYLNNFINPKNKNKKLKRESKKINIAFVGRLSYEKAPDRFLELAKHFYNDSNILFHIYGSGSLQNELKNKSTNNIIFHGHQSNSDFWNTIDVLIICSREEGLPMVLLEAMDNNIISLSNRVGQIETVIQHEHNGVLTNNQSTDELILSLKSLLSLSDKEKQEITINAYEDIQKTYSGKQQIKELKTIYNIKYS
jgi:glycosyltransferase involved in cell wall biosynthesis